LAARRKALSLRHVMRFIDLPELLLLVGGSAMVVGMAYAFELTLH